jgi:large subunit ribosomal protein LP1
MSVAVNPAILEDDESLAVDAVEASLGRTSLSDISRVTPSPNPHVTDESALHGERLSSIDMRDLPTLQDDDTIDLDSQAHSFYLQMRAARSKSPVHKSRTRQATSQPQPNGDSIGGTAHSRTSSVTQHARNRAPFHDTGHASTAFPGKSLPDESDRASSPDLASIIAATPRRRSETSSAGSRSGSRSRRRAHKSLPGSRRSSATGRLSVFSLPDEAARQGNASLASRSLLANSHVSDELWHDDSLPEDYGVEIGGGNGNFGNVPDEDDTAGESDSSLDLHTPLP